MADITGSIHERYVAPRRVKILASLLAPLLPQSGCVVDVGCGDGAVSQAILRLRPDLRIEGIEVLPRGTPEIRVSAYDGRYIPFSDRSFDAVLFVDVVTAVRHGSTRAPSEAAISEEALPLSATMISALM